jgi:phosphoribosyl 1,2-cyclic phosphate phosphodiesterase
MTLIVTILGCGSSGGVPRVGGVWGACNPRNPKNRRLRCSLLVQKKQEERVTTLLVDTGPDLRQQMLQHEIEWVDGVLYTHAHADHCHGIDDLRPFVMHHHKRVDVYADPVTRQHLEQSFGYCFTTPVGSSYPPILNMHSLQMEREKAIAGAGDVISFTPFAVNHGDSDALGYRFNNLAYLPDVKHIPERHLKGVLEGLDCLILDALRYKPHVSHFNVSDALALIQKVRPRRAILTNLHVDLDYDELAKHLPDNVEPAYDGMQISVP